MMMMREINGDDEEKDTVIRQKDVNDEKDTVIRQKDDDDEKETVIRQKDDDDEKERKKEKDALDIRLFCLANSTFFVSTVNNCTFSFSILRKFLDTTSGISGRISGKI